MKFSAALALAGLAAVSANPAAEWEQASPEAHGIDSARMEAAFDYAGSHFLGSESYCVSVHKDGKLVGERHWYGNGPDSKNIAWSVSKAITNTLVGIAEKAGSLNAFDKASSHIPLWRFTGARDVLVDMLMRHDSGRYYDLITDFVTPQLMNSQTDFAIALVQQHDPGTHYQYNQMAVQVLERIISSAVGKDVNTYANEELWAKIGAEYAPFYQTEPIITEHIDPLPSGNTDPLVYGGVNVACRDLARFGQLWMQHGVWDGERVFEEDFFQRGISNAPDGRAGREYHWSGNGATHTATGMGGQFVSFNEEEGLVMTRIGGMLGTTWDAGQYRDMIMGSLVGGVGSYNSTAEAIANAPHEEELQYLAAYGV
jgi:CubicO group peptidase (beta-lactamase class C family)